MKFRKAIAKDGEIRYHFMCPGCNMVHGIVTESKTRPCWQFNGDVNKPTVSPSIKVTYPANPNAEEQFKEWRTERICHSFIREGMIQFLGDCWHDLKGKTVELPEF